jgi:UDP-GlcNAc:undecaprenyl-phosphate GlcNAc-1-phosphate transferase
VLDRIAHFLQALGIAAPDHSGWLMVILTFIIAALAAWLFMPRMRLFSLRAGWADEPNARRLNKEPLPNAGGLAVLVAVSVALIITALLRPIDIERVHVTVLAILLGGSFMIMAGFIDDQFGLPPVFRLVVQFVAALLLVSADIRIPIGFGGQMAGAISIVFTVLWVMAITNAMNLIDGVDGLAGGVSFITAMSLIAVSAQDQSKAAATLVLAAVAGAALGFLRHNLPPSRIIMGDSGAYFFGFVIAACGILGDLKFTTVFSLLPTVLFLFLPLLDTALVILRRLVRGKNPLSTPGTDHIHHRLLARGLSPVRTVGILLGVTLAANIVAMAIQGLSLLVVTITTVGILLLLALVLWRHRRGLRHAAAVQASAAVASPAQPANPEAPATPQSVDPRVVTTPQPASPPPTSDKQPDEKPPR